MKTKVDQGIVIVLDVGRSTTASETKNGKSFFENARECASRIIEKKIMSLGNNLVSVVLLGSKKTANSVAEEYEGACRKIETAAELQSPTWDMIRNLPEKAYNSHGLWLDGLIVAADQFKNGASGTIANKKIILMTNFEPSSQLGTADIKQVLDGFIEEGYEVDVLGPDLDNEEVKNSDFELAKQFVTETKGATAPFEDVMQYLLFHRKKITKPSLWNVDLSIGPNVKIPISALIRLKEEPVVKKWFTCVKDPVTLKASSSEGLVQNKMFINTEDQVAVEPSEVIKGFQYGQQVIPFTDADKSMLYESGERGLNLYGFTHTSNVTYQNMNGDSLYYVFGRKDDKKAQAAIKCLVEILLELQLVGIVRRVYNKGNAPKMFALMPVIDSDNYYCLSMAGICFKEEIKNMAFPPTNLKKHACTNEQVSAFKDLIAAMDLMKAYDDSYDDAEAFPIAETVSPTMQHVLDCIAYRALNPGKPLPQPRDDIMMLFKQPPLVEKKAREPLEKLKSLFTLTKVEVKPKNKRNSLTLDSVTVKPDIVTASTSAQDNGPISDMLKVQMPSLKLEVAYIRTIDPISDYKTLLGKGNDHSSLAKQMTDVIENLFYCNLDGTYSRALEVSKFYRQECVQGEPSHYNNWLKNFKAALYERKKEDILNLLNENQLGVITKNENEASSYEESQDDTQAYDNDTQPNSTNIVIPQDIDDMFDAI